MLKKESVQTKGCDKLMKATLLLLTVDHCLHSFQILMKSNTYIFKQVTISHLHLQEIRSVHSPVTPLLC